METQIKETEIRKLKPLIVRGQTEIKVPYNDNYVSFVYPLIGSNTYLEVRKQILENKLKVPTTEQTASLLYSAYCIPEVYDEPEFESIREFIRNKWLWVFNRNLWTDKGVYVVQDLEVKGRTKKLEVSDLEKFLKNSEELNGVRFSEDGKVRFAPKETYKLEYNAKDELAENGFVIASYGKTGAEQLAKISEKFSNKPYVYGLNIQEGQNPELRVSALGVNGSNWLYLCGDNFGVDGVGRSFGVLK